MPAAADHGLDARPPDQDVIYFDNAATSWPKPPGVTAAVVRYLEEVGANPGRAGHPRAAEAGRLVLDARRRLAALFALRDPMRVLLGPNATWGLNLGLSMLRRGDHAVVTGLEHNSVMRPLQALQDRAGISVTVVPPGADGRVEAAAMDAAIGDHTALVAVNHASNVTGAVQPLAAIGAACVARGVPLLVDAAQSAGTVDIDLTRDGVAMLAFAGHKGLLGPPGTGGLVLAEGFAADRLEPLVLGGTGSRSDSHEQPAVLPDRFESGTLNVAGIAGLAAGLAWLVEQAGGPSRVGAREVALADQFLAEAEAEVPGFTAFGPRTGPRVGVVSFRVAGIAASTLADRLAREHSVLGRQGLHCAPLAHRHLGTFPEGALRFGFGPLNTADQVRRAVAALMAIVPRAGRR